MKPGNRRTQRPKPSPQEPAFRSGAVARMAGMPVATLRIWEQRYGAVRPATAASGHRHYSPADVQRVLLLRQLTEQGHAIGSIATLDTAQLQRVARPGQPAAPPATTARAGEPLRLAVAGPSLALRLQRPAVARRLGHAPRVVAVFDSLTDASLAATGTRADLLLWHAPELRGGVPPLLRAACKAVAARQAAVVYRYGAAAALRSCAEGGVITLREPPDDEALADWLAATQAAPAARAPANAQPAQPIPRAAAGAVPPRRYDDATLTAIASQSSTLACECPRHVAELLMQLSSFEAYSASCAHRDTADARLHGYLEQVAGASRALFESALETLARHEGLSLR